MLPNHLENSSQSISSVTFRPYLLIYSSSQEVRLSSCITRDEVAFRQSAKVSRNSVGCCVRESIAGSHLTKVSAFNNTNLHLNVVFANEPIFFGGGTACDIAIRLGTVFGDILPSCIATPAKLAYKYKILYIFHNIPPGNRSQKGSFKGQNKPC